jgi:hypothetical protein
MNSLGPSAIPQSSFKDTLRLANKTLNEWIVRTLPRTSATIVPAKRELHQRKWQAHDTLSAKLVELNQKYDALKALRTMRRQKPTDFAALPINPDQAFAAIETLSLQMQSLALTESDGLAANSQAELFAGINRTIEKVTTQLALVDTFLKIYPASFELVEKVLTPPYTRKIEATIVTSTQVRDTLNTSDAFDISLADNYFRLYLYPQDRDDNDLTLDMTDPERTQRQVLSQLKTHITHATEQQIPELTKSIDLMLKFSAVFMLTQAEKGANLEYGLIEKWAKMGLWLLKTKDNFDCTRKNRLLHEDIKRYRKALNLIGPLVAQIYLLLSYRAVGTEKPSDLDMFLGESYLETAQEIAGMYDLTREERQIFASLSLCTQARVAYEQQDYVEFIKQVDTLVAKTKEYNWAYVQTLHLAANYMASHDTFAAFEYNQLALKLMASDKIASASHFEPDFKEKLMKLHQGLCGQLEQELSQAILERFEGVTLTKQNNVIHLTLTFEAMPKAQGRVASRVGPTLSQFQIENNQIKMTILSKNVKEVLADLASLERNVASQLRQEALKAQRQAQKAALAAQLSTEKSEQSSASIPAWVAAESVPDDIPSSIKEKKKTRPDPMPAASNTTSSQSGAKAVPSTKELLAKEFGFTVFADKAVTPIYSTRQAQAKRKTKVFLAFDKISEVDEATEQLFKDSLNPHPDGIVTTIMFGKEGAKMWTHPDNLGGQWQKATIRLKLLGKRGGWARAVAIPQQKVTVNQDGKEENHYLFTIGRLVRK